jgi:hypothetical protein
MTEERYYQLKLKMNACEDSFFFKTNGKLELLAKEDTSLFPNSCIEYAIVEIPKEAYENRESQLDKEVINIPPQSKEIL